MNYIFIALGLVFLILGVFLYSASANDDSKPKKSTYERIVELVSPDSQEASTRAKLISEDFGVYFKKYEDEIFDQVGIEDQSELSRWAALVLALEHLQYVVIADWKDQGNNFAWLLGELALSKKYSLDWSKIKALGDDYRPTAEYADLADRVTRPKKLALIWFDIDSDSYPIALIKSEHLPKLQNMAKELSERVLIFDTNAGDRTT